jgi:hypothetical protein
MVGELWGVRRQVGIGLRCRRVSQKRVREHGDMLSYPVLVKQE